MLAGGQSLIPLMKLRFASPGALVDINRIRGLDGTRGGGRVAADRRARAPQGLREVGRCCADATACSAHAAPQISDPIVRNRGTVCGSLAHADPQGDWGSALLAAGARGRRAGPGGSRTIPRREFFVGPFTTTLEPNEIDHRGPRARSGAAQSRRHLPEARAEGRRLRHGRRRVQVALDNGGKIARAGIALTGVGATNIRAERPSSRSRAPSRATTRSPRRRGSPPRQPSRRRTTAAPSSTSET